MSLSYSVIHPVFRTFFSQNQRKLEKKRIEELKLLQIVMLWLWLIVSFEFMDHPWVMVFCFWIFTVISEPNVPLCNIYEIWDSYVKTFSDSNGTASVYEKFFKCINACYPPCERFQYQITVTNSESPSQHITVNENNRTTQLNFMLSNALNMIVYEQVCTYNAHSLISNIGAQLGLWCGASVISVVHLCFWLTESLMWKIKNKKKQAKVMKIIPKHWTWWDLYI